MHLHVRPRFGPSRGQRPRHSVFLCRPSHQKPCRHTVRHACLCARCVRTKLAAVDIRARFFFFSTARARLFDGCAAHTLSCVLCRHRHGGGRQRELACPRRSQHLGTSGTTRRKGKKTCCRLARKKQSGQARRCRQRWRKFLAGSRCGSGVAHFAENDAV